MQIDAGRDAAADHFVKILFQFGLDDAYHPVKAGPHRVENGKVIELVPLRVNGRHLLEPAVAAAETCRHDDQGRRIGHKRFLL